MAYSKISALIYILRNHDDKRFYSILPFLLQNGKIDYNLSDFLINECKRNSKLAVDRLLDILFSLKREVFVSGRFCEINIPDEWGDLIKRLRYDKENLFRFVTLPSYVPMKRIEIESIITSSCVLKLERRNGIFSNDMKKIQSKFLNFYEVLNENMRKIVIQGPPGIGKTVQFRYLTYFWACNKWTGDCRDKLLLNISVKDVKPNENLYDTIIKQNFKNVDWITKNFIKLVLEKNGEDVIVFIDGADELDNSNEDLKNLIGIVNPRFKTVIWTRNWKTQEILYDVLYELKGFNKKQLKNFLSKCFLGDDIKRNMLFDKMSKHGAWLNELARIPILALNFYILFEKENFILDKSRYDIYTNILNLVISDSETLISYINKISKECFSKLSSGKLLLKLKQEEFIKIKLAFSKIIQIIPNTNNNTYELEFCHLSFQEYYAAKFLIDKFSNSYLNSNLKNYLRQIQTKNIFSIMDFIQDKNPSLFNRILQISESAQKKYNIDVNIRQYLDGKRIFYKIDLCNETPYNDDIILTVFEKQSEAKELKLYLNYCQISKILTNLGRYFSSLNTLYLNFISGSSIQNQYFSDFIKFLQTFLYLDTFNLININNIYYLKKEHKYSIFKILNSYEITHIIFKNIFDKSSNDIFRNDDINDVGNTILSFLEENCQIVSIITNSAKFLNIFSKRNSVSYLNDLILIHSVDEYLRWIKFLEEYYRLEFSDKSFLEKFKNNITFKMSSDTSQSFFYENLKRLRRLKNISLPSMELSINEYQDFSNFLSKCKKLKSLDFSNNYIKNDFFQSLMQNDLKNITKIHFSNCGLTNCIELDCLIQYQNMTEIDFSNNILLQSACIKILENLKKSNFTLQIINFSNCGLYTRHLRGKYKIFNYFTNIKSLDFSGNHLSQNGCLNILNNLINSRYTLENICFSDCGLKNQRINLNSLLLLEFLTVKVINFNFNINLFTNGYISIIKLFTKTESSIESLNFRNCSLHEVSDIIKNNHRRDLLQFRQIKYVDFSGNNLIGSLMKEIIYGLCNSGDSLESLNFSGCNLNLENVNGLQKILRKFQQIKVIKFNNNENLKIGIITILKGLANCNLSLKILSFINCGLSLGDSVLIFDKIKKFKNITEVNFQDNTNLMAGYLNIIKGLQQSNSTLEDITFSNCGISDNHDADEVKNVFYKFTNLKNINFNENKNLNFAVYKILNGLANSRFTIQSLNFMNCFSTDEKDIKQSLEDFQFPCVRKLATSINLCFAEESKSFIRKFTTGHSTLNILDITQRNFQNKFFDNISNHLNVFCSLQKINFTNTNLIIKIL